MSIWLAGHDCGFAKARGRVEFFDRRGLFDKGDNGHDALTFWANHSLHSAPWQQMKDAIIFYRSTLFG